MPKETIARLDQGTTQTECAVHWARDSETVQFSITQDGTSTGAGLWSPPLNRHQINVAIRALRKARDQVFGADA